jgi:hypothetical protein
MLFGSFFGDMLCSLTAFSVQPSTPFRTNDIGAVASRLVEKNKHADVPGKDSSVGDQAVNEDQFLRSKPEYQKAWELELWKREQQSKFFERSDVTDYPLYSMTPRSSAIKRTYWVSATLSFRSPLLQLSSPLTFISFRVRD